MERALEQQAQLIGQFETMENAQREWEEKFQRTEIPMLGVAEPGDQVSITENSYCSEQNAKQIDKVEPRKKEEERLTAEHVPFTDETIAGRCRNCEATNRKVEASDKFQSSNSMPTSPAPNTAFQQYDTIAMNGSNSVSQIFRSPSVGSLGLNSKETDIRGSTYEKPTSIIHTDQKIQPHERVISQTTATVHHDQKIHPNVGKISRWENPAIKTLPKLLDQPKSTSLASVIESLERARVSLGKEIIKRPSLSQGTLPTSAPADSPDIPIGHSGLFRLPTDSFPHALLPRPNVYGSGLRLTATRPDIGFITSEVSTSKGYFDQSPNSSYSEAGYQVPSSRRDYMDGYQVISHMNGKQYVSQYPARYLETGSQFSMAKDYSDRFSTMNLMSPSPRESYLPCSGLPMKRMPLHNELPTIPYTNLRNRMPY
ncbi:hypothetical protein AXF42_Ash004695 [Apostasia shenzhenica]|uniref:Uncharacterized protein n=1 Tax=Apostasia shenzhenica TaxID=1088818 RepID=A0A2I0BHC3_9ASPA|nr:hypothetical protein AXF42_Ash004695 [Apostasia shenzhenica]